MNALRTATLGCCLAAVATPLAAQPRTWIVDADNGPGTDFLDLPPAVAAAADGDTLRIRSGTYGGISTGKALTLLGEDGVTILSQPSAGTPRYGIEVTGLPAGRTFVASNLDVGFLQADSGAAVGLSNNAGRVHLEDVTAIVIGFPMQVGAGADVVDCASVTWNGGALSGRPGLHCTRADLVISGAVLRGADACVAFGHCIVSSQPALQVTDSTVQLSQTDVFGGAGSSSFGGFPPPEAPSPAMLLTNGSTTVTGDASTRTVAGQLTGYSVPAIVTSAGTLHVDTTITIQGTGGAPDIVGTATVVRRRIAALAGSGGPPGGTLTVALVSTAGDGFFLAASAPMLPLGLPFGRFYLEPAGFLPLASGALDATGRFTRNVQVPNLPQLRGSPIALQAAVLYQATQLLELSNPVVAVLD